MSYFFVGGLPPSGPAYTDFMAVMSKHNLRFRLAKDLKELKPFMKELEQPKKDAQQEEDKEQSGNLSDVSDTSDGVDCPPPKLFAESQMKTEEPPTAQSSPVKTKISVTGFKEPLLTLASVFDESRSVSNLYVTIKEQEEQRRKKSRRDYMLKTPPILQKSAVTRFKEPLLPPRFSSARDVRSVNTDFDPIFKKEDQGENQRPPLVLTSLPMTSKKSVPGPSESIFGPYRPKSVRELMSIENSKSDVAREERERAPIRDLGPKKMLYSKSAFVSGDQDLEAKNKAADIFGDDFDDDTELTLMEEYEEYERETDEIEDEEIIVDEIVEEVPVVEKDHRYIAECGTFTCRACRVVMFSVENITKHYEYCHVQSFVFDRPQKRKHNDYRESTSLVEEMPLPPQKRSRKGDPQKRSRKGDPQTVYECQECGKRFISFSLLHRHWSVHFD